MPRSAQYVYRSQNLLKLNMQCQRSIPNENTKNKPPSLTFSKIPRTWSFHVLVLQRTAKKCTKNYNARAQLLFCSLNLLFCGVLVAVAVVVCLRSLFIHVRIAEYMERHICLMIFIFIIYGGFSLYAVVTSLYALFIIFGTQSVICGGFFII